MHPRLQTLCSFIVASTFLASCANTPKRPPDILTGNSNVFMEFRSASDVNAVCKDTAKTLGKKVGIGRGISACAYKVDVATPPRVIAPNPCTVKDEAYAALLCHELGHINEIALSLVPDHDRWHGKAAEETDWTANIPDAPVFLANTPLAPNAHDYWKSFAEPEKTEDVPFDVEIFQDEETPESTEDQLE